MAALPPALTSEKVFIEIIQDSAGRILSSEDPTARTPDHIEGLVTQGIQTCIPIVVVGQKGITLIHDTNKLSKAEIANEFRKVAPVVFWTLAYNPNYFPDTNDLEFKQRPGRYIELIEDAVGRNKHLKKSAADPSLKLIIANQGFFSITRRGKIDSTLLPANISSDSESEKRLQRNIINNYFLLDDEEVPIDIQFNGKHFTSLPSPFKSFEQIVALAEHPKYRSDRHFERVKAQYCFYFLNQLPPTLLPTLQFDVLQLAKRVNREHEQKLAEGEEEHHQELDIEILRKYKKGAEFGLPTIETALRRATAMGHLEDVRLLIPHADIDERDETPDKRMTALHWAVEKKRCDCVTKLLAHGASIDIPNARGLTVRNIIESSRDLALQRLFASRIEVPAAVRHPEP